MDETPGCVTCDGDAARADIMAAFPRERGGRRSHAHLEDEKNQNTPEEVDEEGFNRREVLFADCCPQDQTAPQQNKPTAP